MDFSGLSLIKLKKEEMESQVSYRLGHRTVHYTLKCKPDYLLSVNYFVHLFT